MLLPQDNILKQGDTVELEYQLWQDKSNNISWDLTDHEIRFQLNSPTIIKKATANVTGGGDDQIFISDATHGIFIVMIPYLESSGIALGDWNFELEVTTPNDKKFTVFTGECRVTAKSIHWTDEA